ncbi:MAG: RtcB family protein [Balneolaceae bacterium]|nr:RtcB family protein [Balneolaceae bacterium]
MQRVINSERIPIKLWLDSMEDGALEQAKNVANLPFAYKHVAIMPDSHQGYGMPIGGVFAADGCIVPNAVGVDIGCGMCSLRTNLEQAETTDLKKIMSTARKLIPVGFNHHKERQPLEWMPGIKGDLPITEQEFESACYQVGTLGGGNHFIELQKGSDGFIWIMIHSGSRNIGFTVAKHYNQKAKEWNEKWFSNYTRDLAFFPAGSTLYDLYKAEMEYCIEFALANRKLMMERMKESILEVFPDTQFSDFINKPHNFASEEEHFGKNVIIHRKGATRARLGEQGMIPGSQGTPSYIVRGLGSRDSFESCSHGAGRIMSRNEARRTLDLEKEKQQLEESGIVHAIRNKSDLDEAPGSYKDIREVMELQKDLVAIEIELSPLAVIKG